MVASWSSTHHNMVDAPQSLGHVYLPCATIAAVLQPPDGIPDDASEVAVLRAAVAQYAAAEQGISLPVELRNAVGAVVNAAFDSGCVALQAQHALLLDTETSNARVLNNRWAFFFPLRGAALSLQYAVLVC